MRRALQALVILMLCAGSAQAADRREIQNGWYGENLPKPGAEFAVAVPAANLVQTHVGPVSMLPGDDPLYLRVTNRNGFRFAGQGHGTGKAIEWAGSWNAGTASCGVSPVIYDLAGLLHVSQCGSVGSQGYRYVEDGTGKLITGDATYASGTLKLFEYTIHGDIAIGQGPDGGCIAVRGADRRVLEPGHCTFVRFNRAGDELAVTMVKLLEHKTVLLWLTANELSTFPAETPIITPPPPPPPPPPPAQTTQAPNRADVVAAVKRDHPEIDSCDEKSLDKGRAAIVDWAAQRLNALEGKVIWGRKSRGRPNGNTAINPNTDGLAYLRTDGKFEIYDVVSGAPPCETGWSESDVFEQGQNGWWAPPQLDAESGVITPPPTDDPRIAELEQKLAALTQAFNELGNVADQRFLRIQELEAERDDLKQQLQTVRAELEALKAKPAPSCEAKVPGWLRALGIRFGCVVKD